MRRIIHNTTAIAACLSIFASGAAIAETAVQPNPSYRVAQAQGQGNDASPQDEGTLKKLIEAEKQKQARERAQKEKQAEAQKKSRDEKKPDKTKAENGKKKDAASGSAQAKAKEDKRPAKADRAKDGTRPKEKAAARKAEDVKRPAQADRARQEQRPRGKDDRQDRAAKDKKRNDGDRAKGRAEAVRDENKADRARARDDRKDQGQGTLGKAITDAKSRQRREADAGRRLVLARGEVARKRTGTMPGLGAVLASEIDGGLRDGDLKCLSGGSYPCGDREAMITPKGVLVERSDDGQLRLAPADSQMFRANDKGDLVRRVAEEGNRETEGARQAARETKASDAKALLDGLTGQVTRDKVTRDNSRQSSQDFQTSLLNALQQKDGNRQEAKKDGNDNNDLTKALVLGLGALAVGSYLNNNRQVALSSPDRVVVTRADGSQEVIKDEVALLRQPGSDITTENFDDGSSRTVVTRPDGSKVVTIRDADLRVLRRTLISPDGRSTRLIDDTRTVAPVNIAALPAPAQPVTQPETQMDEAALRAALQQEANVDRRFTLSQIRNIPEVRALVAPVDLDAITFDTGSAAIKPDQARQLSTLGNVIQEAVAKNPREIFMVEGYTDTVGSDPMNLALSDRRAESVALAMTEYFDVPPENLVVQGYGEQYLKVRAEGDIRANRRASVRRITDLLQTAQAE
ncbi:MAG: OmpA family protein [Paracoccus sp. (in: a-proteobacteria)]|uniref:OmpA family protein n=1 Tax=Paracoccus sp. TaxID=267 RepID=UPI0030010C59